MSDLLNSASLVMVPSGYKEDTVYSVVPSDGSGDLSFTRASNGTRVNSAGLVEVCPWNLVEQSETFDNAYWTKNRSSISANSTTAPNGTATADSLIEDTANGTHEFIRVLPVDLQTYNLSIYAKANTRTKIQLVLAGSPWATGGNGEASFDLTLGTVISAVNGATGTIESVGNGWYRCTISKITSAADPSGVIAVRLLDASANASYTGNGTSGAYFWGAQLNIGSTAKPYFPTTDRLNVPRLTYQNGGGGCPSLLLEKQSTNEVTYSEDFSQANWVKASAGTGSVPVVTTNYATSPDGTQNADLVVFDRGAGNTSSDFSWLYQTFVTASATYTMTCYVKAATSGDIGKNLSWRNFGTGGMWSVNLTNEWQRIVVQETAAGGVAEVGFYNRGTYSTGNSVSVLMWGFQAEQSSYETSYIPTTSSSATRVADAIGNQTTSIAQAFTDNTKGTIFFDLKNIKFQGGAEARFQFGDSADSLRFAFFMDAVGLGVYGYQGGGYAVNVSTATNQKIAIRFDGTSLTGFSQGVKRNTVTSGTNYVIEQMIGNNTANLCFEINEFVLFNAVLTDAECIALTTI